MDHRHTPESPMANRKAGNESCRWQPWPETVPAPAEAVCGRHRPPPVGSRAEVSVRARAGLYPARHPCMRRLMTPYTVLSQPTERHGYERDNRNGHPGRRMLLVPGGGVQGPARRQLGDVRLCRRPCRQPDLQGRLRRPHRPCRGRAGQIRPGRAGLRRPAAGVLHHPRPDHEGPPGQRCRDAIPLDHPDPLGRAARHRRGGDAGNRRRQDLAGQAGHADRAADGLLRGRSRASRLLRAQPLEPATARSSSRRRS